MLLLNAYYTNITQQTENERNLCDKSDLLSQVRSLL